MRIFLVSNWFPPVTSGSSFYAQGLAQAFHARGHDVAVVTLDWGDSYRLPLDVPFPVYRLPVIRVPRLRAFYNLRLMGFSLTPQNYRRLRLLIGKHRPDVLHYVNHIFDTNLLSTWVAKSMGIPLVGSITTPIQHENPWMQRILTLLDRITVGWFGVRRWDGIVSLDRTVHDYVGEVYGRETQKRSRVIPFGVPLDSPAYHQDGVTQRAREPQILMVGHIHSFRNPTQLIRAMPLVLKEIPEARLILAGRVDLPEPRRVARELGLSERQVEFLGETPNEKVIQLMKGSHIFAHWLTGPYPALGTVSMEAMLCETPVVTDLREDLFGEGKLRHGENIVLVNSKDSRAIAGTLLRLLRDEDLRQKIAVAGRRFVLEHLSWSQIAEQMEDFYFQILKTRKDTSPQLFLDPFLKSYRENSPLPPMLRSQTTFPKKKDLWVTENLGVRAGYVFSYLMFTTFLYLLLRFINKLPGDWSYFHLTGITACVALVGIVFRWALR